MVSTSKVTATPPIRSLADDRARMEQALAAELEKLAGEFDPVLPHDIVLREFDACRSSFEAARIRMYVPVLVYRNARQALRTRALVEGLEHPPGADSMSALPKNQRN